MKQTNMPTTRGKPDAEIRMSGLTGGATPRRGSLLYRTLCGTILFAVCVALALSPAAMAADFAFYISESSEYGFDYPEQWSNGISPTNEAAASTDYVLCKGNGSSTAGLASNKGGSMRGPQTRPTSGGVAVWANSFQIGIKSRAGTFRDCRMADWPLVFANDGLKLMRGEFYREASRNNDGELGGKVTVVNSDNISATGPFLFYGRKSNDGGYGVGGYRMTGAWESGANAKINFFSQWTTEDNPALFTVDFYGDMTGFLGTMSVATNACRVLMDGKTLPGTVNVDAGATFGAVAASNMVTVGTLSLADDAKLHLPVDNAKSQVASVRVTSAFSSDGTAGIVLSALPKMAGGTSVPLLTLASGCSGTIGDGELSVSLQDGAALPAKFELVVRSDPSTGDTVLLLSAKQTGLVISFR